MDCLFCKIINKEIPATVVFENDTVLAFRDISPQAPVHILVIPKKHICCANEITDENAAIISDVFAAIPKIAKQEGFLENGYRIINNCGDDACQTVKHIHFHILAGTKMAEKMV